MALENPDDMKLLKKVRVPRTQSEWDAKAQRLAREKFFKLLEQERIPRPVTEYQFYQNRKWRFDYCWIRHKVALEVEGGVWHGGRHNRGSGFLADMEKYNSAVLLGYAVVRCTPSTLTSSETMEMLRTLLMLRER